MYTGLEICHHHYNDFIMGAIASQITSLTIVFLTFYSDADQRKHQSSASLSFLRGNHRGQVNSPHKWPVTQKMFPFDDVIMTVSTVVHAPNSARPSTSTLITPKLIFLDKIQFGMSRNHAALRVLIHLLLVLHICVAESGHHWLR